VNILVAIHYPIFGGPHNQALLLARALEPLGVHVTNLLPNEPGNAAARLRASHADVVTFPLHRGRATVDPRPNLKLIGTLPREVRAIRHLIRERAIDVVQVGGLVNPHSAIAGRLERAAVVWQLLDTRTPMMIRRVMMPFVIRLSDVVMSTGEEVARVHPGAAQLGGRLRPFFPPVDTEAFTPSNVDREQARSRWGFRLDDVVLGTVGNLNPQKGHEFFLRAAGLTRRAWPRTKVLLVGASHETHCAYELRLHRLCERLKLVPGRDVVFAGGLDDVRPALAAMDVFILSSVPRSEGAPTAVEEAMMMGRPVVATSVGAVPELVEEGVTGALVPPLDPSALSNAILQIVENPSLQAAMGRRARERAIALFSAEECARIHLDAYTAALDHRANSLKNGQAVRDGSRSPEGA
jgi:glycosyltransferase involved in cell wall biosynthesis